MWNTNEIKTKQTTWNTGIESYYRCVECNHDITVTTDCICIDGDYFHSSCVPMFFWIRDKYNIELAELMIALNTNNELSGMKNPYVLLLDNEIEYNCVELSDMIEHIKELDTPDEYELYEFGKKKPFKIVTQVVF